MCSARRLMVFNVCVKFHENMSSGFKVMERTRKLLTDTHTHTYTHTHTEKRRKHYTPMAYFVCRGYNNWRGAVVKWFRAARLWCRKLPGSCDFETGLPYPKTGKLSIQQYMDNFFESGK